MKRFNNAGRMIFLLLPIIFLAGFAIILMLKFIVGKNVKIKVITQENVTTPKNDDIKNTNNTLGLDKKSLALENDLEEQKHIQIVKKEGFEKIVSKPQTVGELIEQIKAEKEKPPLVFLTQKDLEKEISLPPMDANKTETTKLNIDGTLQKDISYRALIDVEVKHIIFSEKSDYTSFTKTHYGSYPKADFEKEMVVILVCKDKYPNRILEIIESKKQKDKIVIKYRVNVFKMSDETKDYYPAIVIKKTSLPIEIKQII